MSQDSQVGDSGGSRVVLGVTGSVAAFKAIEIIRRLLEHGVEVFPVITPEAGNFVTPLSFSALGANQAQTELFGGPLVSPHTELGQKADLILVAPASANVLAKLANGLSDDLLSATLLATRAPVVVAPAMHTEMWEHPAVQKNVAELRDRGVAFVGPVSGPLAGGDEGSGRMAEPSAIVEKVLTVLGTPPRVDEPDTPAELRDAPHEVESSDDQNPSVFGVIPIPEEVVHIAETSANDQPGAPFVVPATQVDEAIFEVSPAEPTASVAQAPSGEVEVEAEAEGEGESSKARATAAVTQSRFAPDMAGVRMLVTAGGTREPIDPVRFIGNRSSGKQGHAIAKVAHQRGADVILVTTAAGDETLPKGIKVAAVETSQQMTDAVMARGHDADIVIMAAAVADFRPLKVADAKIKKDEGTPRVMLEPTVDILATLARRRRTEPPQVLVGFAAETAQSDREVLLELGRKKLSSKGVDLLVANDVSTPGAGFEGDTNSVLIFRTKGEPVEVSMRSKFEVGDEIVELAWRRLQELDAGADVETEGANDASGGDEEFGNA